MTPRLLITGAARGLGLKVVRELHKNFDLVLSSRQTAQEFSSAYKKEGISFQEYHQLDFANTPSDFLATMPKLNNIDVLIHNASPYLGGSFASTKNSDIIEFGNFATNVTLLMRHINFAPKAKIILIGSAAGDPNYTGEVGAAIYQIYKSYLQTLARVLIKEKHLVTVINPATISDDNQPNSVPSSAVLAAISTAALTKDSDNKVIAVYPPH